jgi:hypothetical protein
MGASAPGSMAPRCKVAAVERREARRTDRKVRAAPRKRGLFGAPSRRSAPLIGGARKRDRRARAANNRACGALAFPLPLWDRKKESGCLKIESENFESAGFR